MIARSLCIPMHSEKFRFFEEIFKSLKTEPKIWHFAANSDIPSGVENPKIDFRDTFLTTFNLLQISKIFNICSFYFVLMPVATTALCAPSRIAVPIAPITGHLYCGYGLRIRQVGSFFELRHDHDHDSLRARFRGVPEGYAHRGDDGRERDGPQVGVVDRLLVHHLSVGHASRRWVV